MWAVRIFALARASRYFPLDSQHVLFCCLTAGCSVDETKRMHLLKSTNIHFLRQKYEMRTASRYR